MNSYQRKTGCRRCLTRWDYWLTAFRTTSPFPVEFVCCEVTTSWARWPEAGDVPARMTPKLGISVPSLTCLPIPSLCPSTPGAAQLGTLSLHLQQCVILLSRHKRNQRELLFLAEQHSRLGLIYNDFYKEQVWSRKKTNALEARRQQTQRVGGTWILSSLAGPLPCCATGITGIPWPFAPGTPWSCDETHMLLWLDLFLRLDYLAWCNWSLGSLSGGVENFLSVLQRCQQPDLLTWWPYL